MSSRGSSQYDKKRDQLDLDVLDLTEKVQALFPSELKSLPIDKDRPNRFNSINHDNVHTSTSVKKDKLQDSQ